MVCEGVSDAAYSTACWAAISSAPRCRGQYRCPECVIARSSLSTIDDRYMRNASMSKRASIEPSLLLTLFFNQVLLLGPRHRQISMCSAHLQDDLLRALLIVESVAQRADSAVTLRLNNSPSWREVDPELVEEWFAITGLGG
eukprot:3027630-Pleurochrysis_carterae.AAC.7